LRYAIHQSALHVENEPLKHVLLQLIQNIRIKSVA
jgi:hypothetical protein